MKYKAKTKDCHLIVKAKASFGESIDETALNAFARVYLRGFLKPKLIRRNVIEYTGPVGISLYERLKKPISGRDFLFVMEQIIVAVQKINSNHLSVNNVVLDIHNVFINGVTKEIQFLYVPKTEPDSGNGVISFMESIIYSAVPAEDRDAETVSRYVHFLKSLRSFNPVEIEKYIAREDRTVVNIIRKKTGTQSGFMTSKQRDYYAHYNGGDADEEATALLEEDDTALLDEDEATGLLEEDGTALLEEDGTALLEEDGTALLVEEEDGTALLVEDEQPHYPSLYRVLTEETISVNKPVFRLGKERSYVDYFVNNNNAVSRSHADIITRGIRYYVIDLNSKNHSYINDLMLPAHCETEIRDGDRLRLGNEEFIFHA